jgi:hypothetical protein
MLRKIALSLLMLISVATILPFVDSAARGFHHHRHHRRHRHHSRRWWRHHRALMARRRAAMAHRNAPLMTQPAVIAPLGSAASAVSPAPDGWKAITSATGELRFRSNEPGNTPDQAALSVVALSRPSPAFLTPREQRQILGGVSFAELRRTVIDKMVVAGGWVNNDYEREVSGRRVFIVTAQTPADGRSPDKQWNFYFTEVNGRIYSLATEATLQSAERMAAEAERFIAGLH